MMEEDMHVVGALKIQGNVPCVQCGFGDDCKMSGIKMMYGPQVRVDSVGIAAFEQQPINLVGAKELGAKIAHAVK